MRRDLTELNYETARDYFADPQRVPNPAGGEEPLGFGVGRARALGVPDDQARILADAFAASLITRS